MARTKKPAGSRANGTTANAKAKKTPVRPRAAKGQLVSFEACHKVLDCVELLEMILLNVYDPQDAFPVLKSLAKDITQKDRNDESDVDQQNLGLEARDIQGSRIGGRDEELVYNENEARRNMKTLLLSQRVNRMFKGTIGGSTKLQRALWFKTIFDNQPLSSDRAQWDRAVLRVKGSGLGKLLATKQVKKMIASYVGPALHEGQEETFSLYCLLRPIRSSRETRVQVHHN
ncbi:hypothetical protein CB0940_06942 [Cercospora beticola]|uniref:Uncharacterized protein n=1 Tax=Cercospora beticola TaxID=122368 RepID=A0A2G5HA07_CERBT|nr:hypothetical protein CB0940_06942 [Cercospora beticola]PIA89368.1 hypothetical protein CB0940_06942 [Cercospora beticola]WPB02859.1 hypothetical protein RHO25_007495 [Cercospora beticola]